jgi:hypothetical protein
MLYTPQRSNEANALIKYAGELPPYVSPVIFKVIDQLSTSGITGSSLKTLGKFLSFSSVLIDGLKKACSAKRVEETITEKN